MKKIDEKENVTNETNVAIEENVIADKKNDSEMTEKLYLVLIGTPGIFATIIKWVTRIKYIHIVLGMDEDLKDCYSFGRRNAVVYVLE